MNILATVCKSGGDFGPPDVIRLIDRIGRHMPDLLCGPRMIICLTDFEVADFENCNADLTLFRLQHDWPGWWSKIELFRPGLFQAGDRVLYLDLDTVPVGNFSELWDKMDETDGTITLLRDFYNPTGFPASGVMAWRGGDYELIYKAFTDRPKHLMMQFQNGHPRGDGAFIGSLCVAPWVDYWQDRFSGRLVSYKVHCQRGLPTGASLVCFHGRPRPTEVDEPWLR